MTYFSILCAASLLAPSTAIGARRIKKTDGGILDTDDSIEIAKLGLDAKQKKLLEMCERIDLDKDKLLSPEELLDWTNKTVQKWMAKSIKHQWDVLDNDNNGLVEWSEFKRLSYAELANHLDENDNFIKKDDKPIQRDTNGILVEEIDEKFLMREIKIQKRRFEAADLNSDKALTFEEFPPFAHPEEHKIMRAILAQETLDDMDTNQDGLIDEKEWIHEIYEKDDRAQERKENAKKGIAEPDWLLAEIDHFYTTRDADGDGKMDVKDVENWLNPEGYCPIKSDVNHLMWECDADKDGKLNFGEIMKRYDVFLTSRSTMFGNELHHDEL